MLLIITFPNELIPFQLFDSEENCLKAIQIARKQGWEFHSKRARIRNDFICLHAMKKNQPSKQKRYYIYRDKVLLETSCDQPDEIEPTKELLAYEHDCDSSAIYAINI